MNREDKESRCAKIADDVMDEAVLPERLVRNGIDGALRVSIALELMKAEKRGHTAGLERAAEIAEEQASVFTYEELPKRVLLATAATIRSEKHQD